MGTMDEHKGVIALPAPISGAASTAETAGALALDKPVPPGRAVVVVSAAPEPAATSAESAAAARKEPPAMPRAAILAPAPEPDPTPEAAPADPPAADAEAPTAAPLLAAATARQSRGKFGLLAACVAVAACAGAVAGSLGTGAFERTFGATPVAAAPADPGDDIRSLKEAVTQLRTSVKTIADSLSTLRTSITASTASTADKLAKVSEALDRVERSQADRRAAAVVAPTAAAAAPDITGGIPPAAEPNAGRSGIVEGWTLRRVMGGVAMVEGRYGIVEVEPGDSVPGIGRVREIRRQDGRWVVVTPKGLIVQAR